MSIIAGRFMPMKQVRNTAPEAILEYKTYMCVICGFIYEEEKGLPDDGIPPGTRWEDLSETWTCPDCGASKDDFEMIEI